MPGTFSQIYIQIVFAVKGRHNLILPSFEEEVYKYISGIADGKDQKSLAVNGMPDHITCISGIKTRTKYFRFGPRYQKQFNQFH